MPNKKFYRILQKINLIFMASTEKNTDKNSDKLKALRLTIDKTDKDFVKVIVMMIN